MRAETTFELDGDLIFVEATLVGRAVSKVVHLVPDTGSALTTIVPAVAEAIGYTSNDRVARSIVRTAVADERGYSVCMSAITALGFTAPDVHANVAELGHRVDGPLGMNFLGDLNFEIRPLDRRIIAEKIAP